MLDKTVGYNHETEEILDLSTPSLKALSHILRNRNLWPKEFVWNYNQYYSCAMGLAATLWHFIDPKYLVITSAYNLMPQHLSVNEDAARKIFLGGGDWVPINNGERDMEAVTPEMVANIIDEYLTTKE